MKTLKELTKEEEENVNEETLLINDNNDPEHDLIVDEIPF